MMVGYTEKELKAMDKADEAFAEIKKVAEEFAKQTNTTYYRGGNEWCSWSSFNKPYIGALNCWNKVKLTYDGDCSDAYECMWQIETIWNRAIVKLSEMLDEYIDKKWSAETYEEEEWFDHKIDEVYEARREFLDLIAGIVEKWYDSACEFAYDEYMSEEE